MEYEFFITGLTKSSSELLVTLYKKRKELVGLLNNSTNEKGKKNTSINIQYCVSFQFISKLFLDVFGKDLKDDIDTPAFEIRRDIDFVQFIVSITCESLRFVSISYWALFIMLLIFSIFM